MKEKQPNCELIESTKVLAKQGGFNPDLVICPFIQSCDGTTCFMIEDNIKGGKKTGEVRFISKLEKTVARKDSHATF